MTKDEKTGGSTLKSFKVPFEFKVSRILNYIYDNQEAKNYIIDTGRDSADATDHLALALELPEGRAKDRYIILDN